MEWRKVCVWMARFVESRLVGSAYELVFRTGGEMVWEKLDALESGTAF